MNWFVWALLSAFFAGVTAVLAKVGVQQIDSNMATAIRTVVILIFAWSVALLTETQPLSSVGRRTLIFLIYRESRRASRGSAIFARCNWERRRRLRPSINSASSWRSCWPRYFYTNISPGITGWEAH